MLDKKYLLTPEEQVSELSWICVKDGRWCWNSNSVVGFVTLERRGESCVPLSTEDALL